MEHPSDSKSDTTFLSLPVELRSLVYQDVLDDIIQPPLHPWDEELPTPKIYLTLLLVNREVSGEVSDLFQKLYADKLILYFDNLLHIHWICQNIKRWPLLRNARFWSRAILEGTGGEDDAKTEGAAVLIAQQSGWKEEWNMHPGWFQAESLDFGPFEKWDEKWVPEDDGFERATISHCRCSETDVLCVPFQKLVFPFMDCGHRVTTYRWSLNGQLEVSNIPIEGFLTYTAAMVLEGKLNDLSFEDVPVEIVRKRMACQRRRTEEGRGNEGHNYDCECYDDTLAPQDPGLMALPPDLLLEEMD